jgi:hypothetical protein
MNSETNSWKAPGRSNSPISFLSHVGEVPVTHEPSTMRSELPQEVAKEQQLVFPEQESELPLGSGPVGTRSKQRKANDTEFKPARMVPSRLGVAPECAFRDEVVANDASALGHREIAVRVDDVASRRAVSCFANRFHPQIRPRSSAGFKDDISKSKRSP